MINWIYGFVLLLLFVLENIYFKIAKRYNILDVPNVRSSHHTITLRGGGVIFYLGVLVHGLIFDFFAPWFLCGLTLVALVSFIDDMHPLSAKVRLLIQTFSLLLLLLQLGVHEVSWGYVVVALFVGLAILNIYNFMDGINGITGGYSLVILVSLAYVNAEVISFTEQSFIYTMICSVLVFDFFNFRKRAKCFAGDVGSVSIAFVVLFLIGSLILQTKDFSWLVLLVVYGVDSVLTIVHRLLLHENIGLPHRKHLYQIMVNELRIPHVVVSLVYMIVQIVIIIGYLYCRGYGDWYLLGCILLLSGIYIVLMRKYFHLHLLPKR